MRRRRFLQAIGFFPVAAPAAVEAATQTLKRAGEFIDLPMPNVGYGSLGRITDASVNDQMEKARVAKLLEMAKMRVRVCTKRTLPRIVRTEYSRMPEPDEAVRNGAMALNRNKFRGRIAMYDTGAPARTS